MKLIVGLGNPGREYANTRHNLGFQCISQFAKDHGIRFSGHRSRSRLGVGQVDGSRVILAKPQTFMNRSGESVGVLVRYYKLEISDLLVVYDDVDLQLGRIRIREKGSAAGHNGMKSVISHVGSSDFPRIRVGIRPVEAAHQEETRIPDFVLSNFTTEEARIIDEVRPRVSRAIECILAEGIETAMNRYNANGK